MERFKGTYHGANIFGEGGANNKGGEDIVANTEVSLFELKPISDGFLLAETYKKGAIGVGGAIVGVGRRMRVVTLKNVLGGGIEVYNKEGSDILSSGGKIRVKVGPHQVDIVANDEEVVRLDDAEAVKITKELEETIYAQAPEKSAETEKDA